MSEYNPYKELIVSFEESNVRCIADIQCISRDKDIPEESKNSMISNLMEFIERNNEVIGELEKFA